MARDRNTFAKRQRETGKKQKAAEKRARRQKRKELSSGIKSPSAGEQSVTEPWHRINE
ncbi:MAG: hypothetical protein JXB10_20600 [Pirellulales bacterium]|nr:hypothetical protein [Pirellulales bacterium]